MLVFGPLRRKQLAKKAKLSSVSGRKLSNGAILLVVAITEFKEKRIEHADDLTKAWSQVRIFNPA